MDGHFVHNWTDDNCHVCHGIGTNPQVYLSCDAMVAGPYCNTEDVGESNCRSIMQDIEGAFEEYLHYARRVWVPDNEENREIVRLLEEQYPIYDEDDHRNLRSEWEWADFLNNFGCRYELIRLLPNRMQEWLGEYQFSGEGENMENSCHPLNWDLFKKGMQIANAEWIYEQNVALIRDRGLQKMIDQIIGQSLFNKMRMDSLGCGRSLLNEWFQDWVDGEFAVNWDDDVSVLIGADKLQEDQECNEFDLVVYMRNSINCQVVKPTITPADYVQMKGRSRI